MNRNITNYSTFAYIKPDALPDEITRDFNTHTKDMTSNDFIIYMGGSNCPTRLSKYISGINSMKRVCESKSIKLILCSVPYAKGYGRSHENNIIFNVNNALYNIASGSYDTQFLDINALIGEFFNVKGCLNWRGKNVFCDIMKTNLACGFGNSSNLEHFSQGIAQNDDSYKGPKNGIQDPKSIFTQASQKFESECVSDIINEEHLGDFLEQTVLSISRA